MVVTGYHLEDKSWRSGKWIMTYRVPYELQFMGKEELIESLEDIPEERLIAVDLVTRPFEE